MFKVGKDNNKYEEIIIIKKSETLSAMSKIILNKVRRRVSVSNAVRKKNEDKINEILKYYFQISPDLAFYHNP